MAGKRSIFEEVGEGAKAPEPPAGGMIDAAAAARGAGCGSGSPFSSRSSWR